MPERGEGAEVFSNPLPPSMMDMDPDDDRHPMTNDDFRKLLMTPRAPPKTPGTARIEHKEKKVEVATSSTEKHKHSTAAPDDFEDDDISDPALRRKKKKSYYAKLKKMEEEREKELAMKYRDRAMERREGHNKDYDDSKVISTTADYRAVAPDAKSGESYTERRKQLIQESKYLGGDMEHTHLVKGLDYALLDKVRAEICSKEQEDEDLEHFVKERKEKEEIDPEEQMEFRTKLARNIFRIVFKTKAAERNELFLPRRMAYVVEIDDEYIESDVPCTLIRSKADCPSLEATTTLTTNDIVINKLTQILSYLRQGRRDQKKLKKKDKGKLKEDDRPKIGADDHIYGELGDYQPSYTRGKSDRDRKDRDRRDRDRGDRDREDRYRDRDGERYREKDRERGRDRGERDRDRRDRDREYDRDRDYDRRDRKKSYFEKPAEEDDMPRPGPSTAKELVKSINEKFAQGWAPADIERDQALQPPPEEPTPPAKPTKEDRLKKLRNKMTAIDSYAECYPGMMESADAIDDSDEEVDYTKMDQGNKKGPIGRWDFDTQEEYSDYMSNKEALPKAAFQYGVKMADGRKTRRTGPKDEKKELDREWQKIQNIIQKRKQMGEGEGPYAKQSKY